MGKVVSAYGGRRCPVATAIDYASWGKVKQLAWDRAYDSQNNLCFIAYYDARNAAYAGFMKTLLTPQEREELFRGSENPAEELWGDVLELSLGLLTFGLRYPNLFKKWGSVQDINADIHGIERCFYRYTAKESIKLVAARYPKKRKAPTKDEAVERSVQEIVRALPESRFLAVPSSKADPLPSDEMNVDAYDEAEDTNFDSTNGVNAASLPQEDLPMDHEVPEEDAFMDDGSITQSTRARAWDATRLLVNGSFDVDVDNPQNLCVLCGSSEHGFSQCDGNPQLKRLLCEAFEVMTRALRSYPDVLPLTPEPADGRPDRRGQASASTNEGDVESAASSTTRRPRSKAMPRRGARAAHTGIRVVEYDTTLILGNVVKRRRGENDVCGEPVFEIGLPSHKRVLKATMDNTSSRDSTIPQRGDRRLYPYVNKNDHREGYTNKSFPMVSTADCYSKLQNAVNTSVILTGGMQGHRVPLSTARTIASGMRNN